jgi:hypothetical protein
MKHKKTEQKEREKETERGRDRKYQWSKEGGDTPGGGDRRQDSFGRQIKRRQKGKETDRTT